MKKIISFISLIFLITACATDVNRMSATFENSPPIDAPQFFNSRSGYDIPGNPIGDSIIAFGEQGGRPNGSFTPSMKFGPRPVRQINGNEDIVCHRANEGDNNYAVWRPREVSFNPVNTVFLATFSVDPNMTVRLIFSDNKRSISSGFAPSSSDLAVLEISDNALWAWEIGTTFDGHSALRRRIGDYHTPDPRRGGATTGEVVSVSFNREQNTCNVTVAGVGSINEILDPEFCNTSDSSKAVLAVQASTPNNRTTPFFCTSVMVVNSSPP